MRVHNLILYVILTLFADSSGTSSGTVSDFSEDSNSSLDSTFNQINIRDDEIQDVEDTCTIMELTKTSETMQFFEMCATLIESLTKS